MVDERSNGYVSKPALWELEELCNDNINNFANVRGVWSLDSDSLSHGQGS